MILYKCDNVNCNFITRDASKLHMVKIDDKSFEICDECKKQILNTIFTKTNKNPALPKAVEAPKAKNEQCNNLKNTDVKSKCHARDRIDAFGGVEAIRREYIDNNKTTSVLAKELGIAKQTLAKYLHDNCISKREKSIKNTRQKNDTSEEKESH